MKKYLIASTPILIGVICFIVSTVIGSSIAEDGTLVEPAFFLIPIGFLMFFIGIISLVCIAIISAFKKTQIFN
ncbi:DUF3955 domain-containing protein [Solibacillus sp. MA9]|uniref:DUF3955 domain-containing protein n=1 Tax=Solibacillus palustris TaxID=2908203 RepID=A0ABS9UED5_9BACL|nr:DUF3955 domain-containing protein [Solibacillus sp. MA9]MCH7322715.1 DUF3955 domain-containing protein [Solibacillus sp. MA9]